MEDLTAYRASWLEKWREIKGSSFGPFVEPGIARGLDALEGELEGPSRFRDAAWNAAKGRVERAYAEHPLTKTIPENRSAELWSILQGDERFIYSSKVIKPREYLMDQIRRLLAASDLGLSDGDLERFIMHLKSWLLNDPAIEAYASACEAALPDAKAIHSRILERMRPPYT